MKKNHLDLLADLFDIFAKQHGTGEREIKCFGSVRNKYTVEPVKTVPNGGEFYKKGALCLHREEHTATLLLCHDIPLEGKPILNSNIWMQLNMGRVENGSSNPSVISFKRTPRDENLNDPHSVKLTEMTAEIFAEMQELRNSDEYEKTQKFVTKEKTLHL